MKPHLINRDIQSSGVTGSRKMSIDESDAHIVFGALTSTMYKDPIKAVWREYLTNAYDEHIRLDKTEVPFEVTFPNLLSPTIKIRDFGRGLSEEQVFEFFGKLGKSDKRKSDKMMGYYGFGCKVGHAYTDSFTITSVLNGVKRIFNVFVGQDNFVYINKLGDDFKVSEPNGVEISLAVKPEDIDLFINKGLEVLRYFPTKPIIHGLDSTPNFETDKPITSGDGWSYHQGYGAAVCIMGVVAYEIDRYAMGQLEEWERLLLQSNLHIKVDIGSVDLTPARENLRMTDRTKAAIKAKLKAIKDEMIAQTEKEFAVATTLFDAKALYFTTIQNGGGFGQILRNNIKSIKWQGLDIKSAMIDLSDSIGFSKHRVLTYTIDRRRKNKISYMSEGRLVCTPEIGANLFYDDTDGKTVNYKRRARTLFDANTDLNNIWIISTSDVLDFEAKTGLKVSKLKSYKAITPTFVSVARGGTGIDFAKRKKHQTKVFELDVSALDTYYGAASDKWKIKNIDLKTEKGLFLRIDRFQPTQSKINNLRRLRETITLLANIGIKIDLPIYGLKLSIDNPGSLTHFDQWLKEQVEKLPLEVYALADEYSSNRAFRFQAPAEKLKGKAKEYAKLQKQAQEAYNRSDIGTAKALLGLVGTTIPESTKLQVMSKELLETYPLLKHINSFSHKAPEVINYLNSIEKEKQHQTQP